MLAALKKHRWITLAIALYVGLFNLVADLTGAGPIAAVLPVIVIGWSLGMWAGIAAGVLSFPATALLVTLFGDSVSDVLLNPPGLLGSGLLVVVGAITGRLRDIGGELFVRTEQRTELLRRLQFEELLTKLSTTFVNADEASVAETIGNAQGQVAKFLDADRSVLLDLSADSVELYSQWTRPGLPEASRGLRSGPNEALPWATNEIMVERRPMKFASLDDVPTNASAERRFLEQAGIKSYIGIPLIGPAGPIGVLSFEALTAEQDWSDANIRRLEVAGELFTAVLMRSRTEETLRRTNRILSAITAVSETLVRSTDEQSLIDEVCRIIVDGAGYELAWVGLVSENDDASGMRPAAKRGDDHGYLSSLNLGLDDHGDCQGPTCTAVRSGQTVVVTDMAASTLPGEWRDAALQRNYMSMIAIPLIAGGITIGSLTVYSSRPRSFEGDEEEMLLQLANDVAYGTAALRSNAKREHVEERLRELIKSKDQFVASVAHEVRTPLSAVVGLSQELANRPRGFSPEETAELIGTIATESNEVANLVEDLLVVARADVGRIRVVSQPTDLGSEISQVLDGFDDAKKSRIEHADSSVKAAADPVRVRQIVRNLLTNALRYGGDRIRTETELLDEHGFVRVMDDGPPVPPNRREEMFEPYVGSQDASVTSSVGLGLAVSRTLARLMGGDLTYRHSGDWSIFELQLPLVEPTQQHSEQQSTS